MKVKDLIAKLQAYDAEYHVEVNVSIDAAGSVTYCGLDIEVVTDGDAPEEKLVTIFAQGVFK